MRAAFGSWNWSGALNLQMRLICFSLICILLGSGCGKSKGTVLGKEPSGKPQTVLSVRAGTTPSQFTLTGVMIEKCPTAGCWFRLRDSTGVIKVDAKSAGFVVVDVPLETKITVAGRLVAEGNDVQID